jgi:hypothetical protein
MNPFGAFTKASNGSFFALYTSLKTNETDYQLVVGMVTMLFRIFPDPLPYQREDSGCRYP